MTVEAQITVLELDLAAAWDEIEDIRILTTYRPSAFELLTEAEKAAHLDAMFGPVPASVADCLVFAGGQR